MTVEIRGSALSISESLDSLKTTPLSMHRVVFRLQNHNQWYAVMKEARSLYGKSWRGQPRVKRRLERNRWSSTVIPVWFEVPDPSFASWCAVKLGLEATVIANK